MTYKVAAYLRLSKEEYSNEKESNSITNEKLKLIISKEELMKVVTICGSMKFKDKMMEVARDLEIKNKYVVIQCVYSNDKFNEEEQVLLADLHYKKIDISDAIYVVNVDGYIGTSTKKEIEYAKSLNKEIFSLEPLNY